MELKFALDLMINHYGDLDALARSLNVDGNQVVSELAKVDSDTPEGHCLKILAKYNQVIQEPAKKEVQYKQSSIESDEEEMDE